MISATASPAPAPSDPPSSATDSLDTLKIVLPYGRHDTTVTFTNGLFLICFNTSTDYVFGTDYTVTAPATQTFSVGTHSVTWTVEYKSGSSAPEFEDLEFFQTVQVELPPCDSLRNYNGHDYPAVRIGYYCWLAENLRNEHYADGAAIPDTRFYNDDSTLLEKYGRLYTWNATMRADAYGHPTTDDFDHTTVQGVCPDGWRLPTKADFTLMVQSSGELANVKSNENEYYWLHSLCGEDPQSGFKALPCGYYSSSYRGLWGEGHFWLYDPDITRAWGADVMYYCPDILYSTVPKEYGYSVRCIAKPPVQRSDTTAIACGFFVWNRTTYTESGNYEYKYTSADGRQHIDSLHLTVNPVYVTEECKAIGKDDFPYEWHGKSCGSAGVWRDSLSTAAGCDSIFVLTLKTTADSSLTFTANGIPFKMKFVEGGTFTMGCTSEQADDCDEDETPAHEVTLSSFYMGETEVTQSLWEAVMGGWPDPDKQPSTYREGIYGVGDDYPAYNVSWNDIKNTDGFVDKLNGLLSDCLGGRHFDLPTEAQWEYAARGGNCGCPHKFAGSDSIEEVAWYSKNSGGTAHPVKCKMPNELGLYDMVGNVWEVCSDHYSSYYGTGYEPVTDPQGPATGSWIVIKGGTWCSQAINCRVSYRNLYWPDNRDTGGFRLVLLP